MQDIYQVKIKDAYGKIHNLLGIKGDTPVRGTDYWTNEDKNELLENIILNIENQVLNYATLTLDNDIEFSPLLHSPAYVLKYEDTNNINYPKDLGTMILELSNTNQILISTDTKNNLYNNGIGYKNNYGLNEEGKEILVGNYLTTGYIELKELETLTLEPGNGWESQTEDGQQDGNCYLALYDGGFNLITSISETDLLSSEWKMVEGIEISNKGGFTISSNNLIRESADDSEKKEWNNIRYIRVTAKMSQEHFPFIKAESKQPQKNINNNMLYSFNSLIPQNIILDGYNKIGVYDINKNRLFGLNVEQLKFDTTNKKKLYSFGLISDIHYDKDNNNNTIDTNSDLAKIFTKFKNMKDLAFVCVTGDLTEHGHKTEFSYYAGAVGISDKSQPWNLDDNGKMVKHYYTIPGNHDARYLISSDVVNVSFTERLTALTGHTPYYYFEQLHDTTLPEGKKDIFIMLGMMESDVDENGENKTDVNIFNKEELSRFYNTLKANKNNRIFVMQHVRPTDRCGNALGIYKYNLWGGSQGEFINNLMEHYPNAIMFHGHSHTKLNLQKYSEDYKLYTGKTEQEIANSAKYANIDEINGSKSIHVPSCTRPRGMASAVNPEIIDIFSDSEGYIVDVYEDGIKLNGYDFITDEPILLAQYWIPTDGLASDEEFNIDNYLNILDETILNDNILLNCETQHQGEESNI